MSILSARARLLSPAGQTVVVIGLSVVALLLVMLAWWALASHQRHKQEVAQEAAAAKVAPYQGKAQAQATDAVASQTDREITNAADTARNHDAIIHAPGAQAPVDPGVDDAGLRALCLRRTYASQPQCVRLRQADPAKVSGSR
jgi:hypothetical protein